MLKNIKIQNFGSYVGFDGLREKNHFKRMNIFYGANYSGKTTLSRIVSILDKKIEPVNYGDIRFSLFFEDTCITEENYKINSKNILVFNKDFISDNLSFLVFNDHEKGSIKGFDAIIVGQDQIAIDNKITELNKDIETLLKTKIGVELVINEISIAKDSHNKKKIAAERLLEKKLTDKARSLEEEGLTSKTRTYKRTNLENDIDNITKRNPELKRTLSNLELEKKRKDITVSEKPIINFESKKEGIVAAIKNHLLNSESKLKEIVKKSITKELDGFFADWSLKGYELHKNHNKDHCAFCGGVLRDEVLNEYKKYIENKEGILRKEINEIIKAQEGIVRALKLEVSRFPDPDLYFYDSFKNEYRDYNNLIKALMHDFLICLDGLEEKLKIKLENFEKVIAYDFNKAESCFENLIELYEKSINICNLNDAFTVNISVEQAKFKAEILEESIIDFLNDLGWWSERNDIYGMDLILDEFQAYISSNEWRVNEIDLFVSLIKKEIEELNSKKSTQLAASELVNKFLNSFFGHEHLSLKPLVDGKDGKFTIVRNGVNAYNLSEGECTLVSFCYFIALAYNLKSKSQLQDYIVYIDDPISSLDSNNIFYIFSLIEGVFCDEESYKQLFISTHNLEFFKYLRKLSSPSRKWESKKCNDTGCNAIQKNEKADVEYYFIKKNNGVSEISPLPNYLKKYNTEFNYLFSQIWNCAHMETELTEEQIYNFGNNMRKFFEVYNYFKYPVDHNKAAFRKKFFDADKHLNHFNLVDRIANEYSHAEELFQRTMKPISSEEMIQTAKFVLDRLKFNDAVQYSALELSIKDLKEGGVL